MVKNILIIGGSFAGVSTAHRLLKAAPKTGPIHITIVSNTTHLYWNIATTRAIIPGALADDKIFAPLAPGFKQYGDRFELVIGTAQQWDEANKRVRVGTESGEKVLTYDYLILATGTSTKSPAPFKGAGSYEATKEALHEWQAKVKAAKSIVVGGAGPTGVEVAGELGSEYGKQKKITLISSGAVILEGTPASVSKTAAKQLSSLSVTVTPSTKITNVAVTPAGPTELTLSSGTKVTCDLYIPTSGLTPNSAYVPERFKNPSGFVLVDQFLGVKGATDAWAVGDVSSVQRAQYVNTEKQSVHVVKNIGLLLKGQSQVPYKVDEKNMLAVPVGKKQGTGHMGNMKFPSFMIVMIKAKTLFTQNMLPTINGANA